MAVLYRDPTRPPADEQYVVAAARDPFDALLDPGHPAWSEAHAITWGPDRYRTEFRALWSRDGLHARFDCADDAPWHTLTRRDAHLWEEEVIEIFIDPAGRGEPYVEIEVSPANVVCDLRVLSPWPDLSSDVTWHFDGLETRVVARAGCQDGERHWTVTAALPWCGFATLCEDSARLVPPSAGDRWSFNVFRIKRPGGPRDPERDAIYAAWSVPEGPSFHAPSAFRALLFGDTRPDAGDQPAARRP